MQRCWATIIQSARPGTSSGGECAIFARQARRATVFTCRGAGVYGRRVTGALLSQSLHAGYDPYPVSDAKHPHFLEGCLIQLEKDISSNVVLSKELCLMRTLDTG